MTEEAPVTAVAALSGRAIRYAEVERPADGPAPRLRRLGTCDFDIDVEEAVFGSGSAQGLDAAGAALREVFRESTPRVLTVVARPPSLVSFFSPLPETLAAAARYEQLREEAALLADVTTAEPVRIRAIPVRTEEWETGPHRWHHVVHVSEPVHARLTLLARGLGAGTYDLLDSTQTVAAVTQALLARATREGRGPAAGRPFALAVGLYEDFAEFSLSRETPAGASEWVYGLHTPGGGASDAAYFAAAMLERLGVEVDDVGSLFYYGDGDGRPDVLAGVLGVDPVPLDPLPLFGRRPEGVDPASLAAFAPCLGAVVG